MKKRRERRNGTKKYIRSITAGIIVFLCACMTFGGVFMVSAHENELNDESVYKYYKSIEIQPGDTLWDIAEETMTSEYTSTAEYVQVLKEINNLKTDDIQSGQHLIIAYEDTQFIP